MVDRKIAARKAQVEKLRLDRQEQLSRELARESEKYHIAIYKRGKIWWYKFNWNGATIRESTRQANKRTAEQMEAAHKTSLAKGEVGIRKKERAPKLAEFAPRFTAAIKVASDIFFRQGFHAIGVDAVIKRSRVAAMTFYRQFKSKENLVLAALQREDQQLREELMAEVKRRAKTPLAQLRGIFDVFGEKFRGPGFYGCALMKASCEYPSFRASDS